jgi:hypothetical protein
MFDSRELFEVIPERRKKSARGGRRQGVAQ